MRAARAIIFILAIVIIAYGIAMPFMPPERSASIGAAILVLVATGLTFFAYRAFLGKSAYRFGRKGDSGVTKKEILVISTDMLTFLTWISFISQEWVLRQIPTDTGHIVLDGIPTPWPTQSPIPAIKFLEFSGTRVYLNPDGSERDGFLDSNWMFRFDVVRLGDKRTEITAECREPALMGFVAELLARMKTNWPDDVPVIKLSDPQFTPVQKEEPITLRPTKPQPAAPLDDWFAYYHACKQARIKFTLADLAEDAHRSHGAVRAEHAKYMDEHRDEQKS